MHESYRIFLDVRLKVKVDYDFNDYHCLFQCFKIYIERILNPRITNKPRTKNTEPELQKLHDLHWFWNGQL